MTIINSRIRHLLIVFAGACLLAGPQAAAQTPTAWQLLNPGDPPSVNTHNPSFVFDSARGIAVQLRASSDLSVTWELTDESWNRKLLQGPMAFSPCVAYDPDRSVTILFGGYHDGAYLNDTWEYDGVTWVQRLPATTPPPRSDCGLVYDSAAQRMVLFGGYQASGFAGVNDTWEYDGVDWTQVTTKDAPPPRGSMGMAYDSGRDETVVFGGRHLGALYGNTWVYNGRNWRLKNVGTAPPPRQRSGMVYDPGLGKTILFSGNTEAGTIADTWEWDGRDWTELFPTVSPPARNCTLAYDSVRQKVLLHGGTDRNDTWLFDGTTWTEIAISSLPFNRYHHALTYDSSRGAVMLYGGRYPRQGDILFSDTWYLTVNGWELQAEVGAPSANFRFPIAYDTENNMAAGFSGWTTDFVEVEDVHLYAGTPPSWESNPVANPLPRARHAWTYAQPLGGFVLFGGNVCCFLGSPFLDSDTWIYDGIGWEERFPAQSPAARAESAIVFDEILGQIVLYGGKSSASGVDADTWLYDGENWVLHSDPAPPGPRYLHRMAYDSSRDVTVLFGSSEGSQEGVTWEFDGTTWTARPTSFQPESNRRGTDLAYDAARQVVVMFGGEAGYYYNDTWAYGADPDLDGIVGLLDNCVDTVNVDQVNADGDPAGDACDCAVDDPGSFGTPGDVAYLLVDGDVVSWEDQAPHVGGDVTYDLVSGLISDLHLTSDFSMSTCLAPDWVLPNYTDSRIPALGDGFYYLVRSKNVCGIGIYGLEHAGLDAASPCP